MRRPRQRGATQKRGQGHYRGRSPEGYPSPLSITHLKFVVVLAARNRLLILVGSILYGLPELNPFLL